MIQLLEGGDERLLRTMILQEAGRVDWTADVASLLWSEEYLT